MAIANISSEKIDKIINFVVKRFLEEDASIGIGSGPIIDRIVEEFKYRAAEIKKKRIQIHCTKVSTQMDLRSVRIPAYCSPNQNEVPMVDFYIETADNICNMSKTDKINYQIFIRTDSVCRYSWLLSKNARSIYFVVNGDYTVKETVRGIPMELASNTVGQNFFKTWPEKMGGQISLRRNMDAVRDRFFVEWAPEQIETNAEGARSIYDWRAIQQELNTTYGVLSHNLYCGSNCQLLEPDLQSPHI